LAAGGPVRAAGAMGAGKPVCTRGVKDGALLPSPNGSESGGSDGSTTSGSASDGETTIADLELDISRFGGGDIAGGAAVVGVGLSCSITKPPESIDVDGLYDLELDINSLRDG